MLRYKILLCCTTAGVSSEGFSKSLQQPTPFAAVDSINPDDTGRLKFHYVVVEASADLAVEIKITHKAVAPLGSR